MTTKPTTCSIITTRSNNNYDNQTPYTLTIEDEVSGCVVCEVSMSAEQFAAMLTGSMQTKVSVQWLGVQNIGKTREVKTELVKVPEGSYRTEKVRVREAVAEFEVDGWRARGGDAGNHHRHKGGGVYEVVFIRFVDGETISE